MAAKKARKSAEAKPPGAVIIPFPAAPRRGAEIAAKLPFSVVPRRDAPASKAAPKSAKDDERPAPFSAERPPWKWWQIGIAASVALHLFAATLLQAKYAYDLERAAGAAAAAAAEGAAVIPIEVLVTAALPSAPAPADATAPDAKPAAPQSDPADNKRSAPPQKDAAATETVPAAKDSPQPDKDKQERKNERASQSAAANPSPAAAARAEGRAGAGGRLEAGGNANVSSYQAEVLAHLQHYRLYPAEARSRGITGTATVHFALAANGSVVAAALVRSSGAAVLDEAALSMVRRASPFPPFPPGIGRAQMDFAAPIRFDLR
jgi:TonB family protein